MSRLLFVLAGGALSAVLAAQHADMPAAASPQKPVTLLSGTGPHRHPIATSSSEAQKFFDQGMVLLFGFNHEEAFRSFEKAAELDPKAAMPHWGMAIVLGANYNDPAPVDERLLKARAEVEKALALSASGPENERAYAEALAARYVADPARSDKAKVARDYATAMKALTARYPDDLDAATLYAESLMNLTPWKLWTPAGEPGEYTLEIVAVLESVLKRDPQHPGANHYYIHAVEASKSPERALPSAARLETLVPAAGHLVHMPAHVYVRTGDYVAAEKSNAVAADVDRAYIRETGAQGMYPVMYYNHNVHFESYAALMAGRHAVAKRAGDQLFDGRAAGRVHGPDARRVPVPAGLRRPALPPVGRHPEDARSGPEAASRARGLALRARDGRGRAGKSAARRDVARCLRRRARRHSRAGHGGPAEHRGGAAVRGDARPRRSDRRGAGRPRRRARGLEESRRGRGRARSTTSLRRGTTRPASRSARRCSRTARRRRRKRSSARTSTSIPATVARSTASRRASRPRRRTPTPPGPAPSSKRPGRTPTRPCGSRTCRRGR